MTPFAYDKNGIEIETGSDVLVPEPNDTDIHNHEFQGVVKSFRTTSNGTLVTVEDQAGDCFDIEPERLEVI